MTAASTREARWAAFVRSRTQGAEPARAPRLFERVRWTVIFVAFLAYVFAITTYRLPIGNIAMMAGLLGVVLQPDQKRLPGLLVWFAAFIFWCAVGYVVSPYPDATRTGLIDLLKVWAVVLVAVNALRSPQQIRLFIVFFLGCFALYPLRGSLFNYFIYNSTVFGRAIWNYVYSNPNDLAALALLQLSMVASVLATERRGWVKRAAQVGAALLPLLVLMTQSRGGFLALLVFAATCAAGQWRRLRAAIGTANRARTIVFGIAIVAVVAFFAPDGVWQRVAGLQHLTTTERLDRVDREGSARQRYEIWKVAGKMIRTRPLTGVGIDAYPLAHESYARGEEFNRTAAGQRDTHSTVLNLVAETGIPGLLIWIGVVLSVVLPAERLRRRCKRQAPEKGLPLFYLEAGLVAFAAAGIFGSFAHLSFLYIHLGLLWALTQCVRGELEISRWPAPTETARHLRGLRELDMNQARVGAHPLAR